MDQQPDNRPSWAEEPLEQLLTAYQGHFDILRNHELLGTRLPAMASFHSRGEKYVLSKRAKLWAIECHEHVLFFMFPQCTQENIQAVAELLEKAEPHLVKPHSEHMYTYLSAVILTQGATADVEKRLRRYKLRKNYRLSLHGWCQARLAMYNITAGTVTVNADGRELKKTLRKVLKL